MEEKLDLLEREPMGSFAQYNFDLGFAEGVAEGKANGFERGFAEGRLKGFRSIIFSSIVQRFVLSGMKEESATELADWLLDEYEKSLMLVKAYEEKR